MVSTSGEIGEAMLRAAGVRAIRRSPSPGDIAVFDLADGSL
jgi:hypothetical protein